MNEFQENNTAISLSDQDSTLLTQVETPPQNEEVSPVVTKTEKKRSPETEQFKAFVAELDQMNDSEKKIRATIAFMETALGKQTGTPYFKSFWDARDLCLELFKHNIAHQAREVFWERYKDLSKEARTLKEMLDKQSAFAMEQIKLALDTLETELAAFEQHLEKVASIDESFFPESLAHKKATYQTLQQKLNLLNAYAVRINTMRRELVKTEMRVRYKNQLFLQLSKIGDQVFPKRKELIDEVSQLFSADIDDFLNKNMESSATQKPFFVLREEIKMMQSLAKELTINTHAFTNTRLSLSKAWDKIKDVLKEKRKEKNEYREVSKKNCEEFTTRIQQVIGQFTAQEITMTKAQQQLRALSDELHTSDFDHYDVKYLKDEIQRAQAPLRKAVEDEENRRQAERREQEELRQKNLEKLKLEIDEQIQNANTASLDQLGQFIETTKTSIKQLVSSKYEQKALEQRLKPLLDAIANKNEQALLNLSQDDQNALQQLKDILEQRESRKKEIKEQIELCRREASGSCLDFEKALACNQQMQLEKERLEAINLSIGEIEAKIAQLQKRPLS